MSRDETGEATSTTAAAAAATIKFGRDAVLILLDGMNCNNMNTDCYSDQDG